MSGGLNSWECDVDVSAETPKPRLPEGRILVGGSWQEASEGTTIDVVSPSDGLVIGRVPDSARPDVDAAVAAARNAFESGPWSRMTAAERGRLLLAAADLIADEAADLAALEALDTGKPTTQARNDIAATVRYFEYYGGGADKVHGETIPFLRTHHVQTIREPLGVTAHIIPWNYPAQMFGRTLAPALAMGNAVVLKPAEDACMTPLRLAEILRRAGFPPGSLNVVTGQGETAGAALAGHPGIDFISFTGSPEVGTQVQAAAAANHVGCNLELGGKSPQILFEDCDLDEALPVVVNAIIQNGGQTCSAGSRVLVQTSILTRTIDWLARRFEDLVAAPHFEDRDLGPLISDRQLRRVKCLLDAECNPDPVARGLVATSAPPDGYYFAPVLFGPVSPDLPIAREELFGPVLCCIPFETEEDAIRIANGTEYGLVAGVWTRDGARQARLAKALRCGQVFVNCFGAGGGIELPFGGVGRSGHGREKGFEALREFSQVKTVVHKHG